MTYPTECNELCIDGDQHFFVLLDLFGSQKLIKYIFGVPVSSKAVMLLKLVLIEANKRL